MFSNQERTLSCKEVGSLLLSIIYPELHHAAFNPLIGTLYSFYHIGASHYTSVLLLFVEES